MQLSPISLLHCLCLTVLMGGPTASPNDQCMAEANISTIQAIIHMVSEYQYSFLIDNYWPTASAITSV